MATRCFSPPDSEFGTPVEQAADAQQIDDGRKVGRRAAVAREPAPVEQVAAHAEMREEAAVLEDVADAAAMLGHEDAALGIDQHLAVDGDAAAIGPDQSAHDIDQRGLARARAAEQGRQPGAGRKARDEMEGLARMVDIDLQAHAAI